jgi:small subunit ribosomal protein S16
MPVKIRLTRMGKKKQPSYRVVVVDSRKPRDGAYIEQIGRYDPRQDPSLIEINNDRALDWLQKGAQPTERAKKLLEISGAWTRFAIDRGEIHTVGSIAAPAPEPEPATAPEPAAVAAPQAEAAIESDSADDESAEATEETDK